MSGTDDRFTDYYGSIQSVVTSGAVADTGMFDPAARDDRFRPFEGTGAISTWTLALPVIPSFDYASITDVILHVRYTARDGGTALAIPATKVVTDTLGDARARPLCLLLSLRHDFPTQWYAFASGQAAKFTAVLPRSYFPYVTQDAMLDNFQLTLYSGSPDHATGQPAQVTPQPPGAMKNDLNNTGQTTLDFAADPKVLKPGAADVFLIVRYTATGISIKPK